MSESSGVIVGGIIIPTLLFIVGLLSAKSNKIVARVFMSVAIGWILIASLTDYQVFCQDCVTIHYSDTFTAVVETVIFWLMLTIMIVMRIRRILLNRRVVGNNGGKMDGVVESKKEEYYDDLL